jgi:hypothetical protein
MGKYSLLLPKICCVPCIIRGIIGYDDSDILVAFTAEGDVRPSA